MLQLYRQKSVFSRYRVQNKMESPVVQLFKDVHILWDVIKCYRNTNTSEKGSLCLVHHLTHHQIQVNNKIQ